jgi:hypothetical protein
MIMGLATKVDGTIGQTKFVDKLTVISVFPEMPYRKLAQDSLPKETSGRSERKTVEIQKLRQLSRD